MSTVTVKMEFNLSDEFIGDVMVTMVESGYDSLFYWGTPIFINRLSSTGVPSVIALVEDEEVPEDPTDEEVVNVETHTLTADMVAPAIERIINERLVGSELMHYLMRAVQDDDAGDVDATLADCILQVAVLGEVRYG